MGSLSISKAQARRIILKAAGLADKYQFGEGIEAVYRIIDHLGFVQLDTNYVVERAHHHVFFARIPDYETNWLNELCEDGRVFEYFSSDSGFHPMSDFRFTLPIKQAFKDQKEISNKAMDNVMKNIIDQVERDGPVMVGDFSNDRVEASTGWWDWRPSKVALEKLYMEGTLMISRDDKFHKRYDVPLNLIPQETNQVFPTPEKFARFIIRRTLVALGISSVKEMSWRSRRVKNNQVKSELQKMIAEGEVQMIEVEGVKGPLYMLYNQDTDIEIAHEVYILSPFDILNVFRHRLRDFFNFDYQVECFVPAPKRLYGYFSLPVLFSDQFIARMDAKADRKNKVLIVHNIHFENVPISQKVLKNFVETLKAFISFNKCFDVRFGRSNNENYLQTIKKGFKGNH